MKHGFLEPTDKDAFLDFPEKREVPEGKVECALCQGHGGWNLEINAYPHRMKPENREDTAENRHLYCHFRASCSNCNGWGYVDAVQGKHVHEWDNGRKIGNCLTEYGCKTCGEKQTVDSSD
jgi:hypothetical protein